RRPPSGNDDRHAHLPRQLEEHLARRGRLRSGRAGRVRRNERGRLVPRVRQRTRRQLRAAALRTEGKESGARPRFDQNARAREQGRAEAAYRRGGTVRSAREPLREPAVRLASSHHGNLLTEDDQWRKLQLVVEVAREVWGGS